MCDFPLTITFAVNMNNERTKKNEQPLNTASNFLLSLLSFIKIYEMSFKEAMNPGTVQTQN